jgi:hypothetical protein
VAVTSDGRLGTALDADAACAHCVSIIGDDYGELPSWPAHPVPPKATRVYHGCDLDPRGAMLSSTEESE